MGILPDNLGGWSRDVLLVLLLNTCAVQGAAGDSLNVVPVPSTRGVIRYDDLKGEASEIRLECARNEFESFQVVLQARGKPVQDIDVSISDLANAADGAVIPSGSIELFRIYYLNVLQPSAGHEWKERREYPGPMLPARDPYSPGHESYGLPFDNTRIGNAGKPYRKDNSEGTGFVFPCGSYTGRGDRQYVIQVDTSGNAGEGATFRWSDTWIEGLGGDAVVKEWNAEKVPVPPFDPVTRRSVPVELGSGVAVCFAYGVRKDDKHDYIMGQTHHFATYENMNEVVWADIYVPDNASSGDYHGVLTVTIGGREHAVFPVKLHVYPFALPREKSVVTAFHGSMSRGYFSDCPDSEWLYEVLRHRHRIDGQRVHNAGMRFDRVTGEPSDWSSFDGPVQDALDGRMYPDGVPARMFCLPFYSCGNPWQWEHVMKKDTNRVTRVSRAVAAHLKDKGWMERTYVYCHDEPYPEDFPNIIRDIRAFLAGDPDWRGRFMATCTPTVDNPMLPWVDIWCVIFNNPPDDATRAILARDGRKLWAYACCIPYSPVPAYHVDSIKGYEPRIIKWAAWRIGAEGFLHWMMNMCQKHPNPWTTPMTFFNATGDGQFFFAGARDGRSIGDNATPLRPVMGPLVDFRVKQIREGLEDWEYLIMCERLRGREFVDGIAGAIYRGAPPQHAQLSESELEAYWTQDENRLLAARRSLARAIVEAGSGE